MLRSRIIGTGFAVPDRIVTNHDLSAIMETTDEWIRTRIGIQERRWVTEGETGAGLAKLASERAITRAGIDPSAIDAIVFATSTPDHFAPGGGVFLQRLLGLQTIPALDIRNACSGFIYSLSVADAYVKSGMRHVLVIGSEVMSAITDWTDRNTCVLFGDGAGAVIVSASDGEQGILSTHLRSDGTLCELIMVPGGGSRTPPSEKVIAERLQYIKMKGNETFKVAVRTLEEIARTTLSANGLRVEDLDLYVPHQANVRILKAVIERLGLPKEKVLLNLDRYGNTSAASIPIALDEAVREGRIKDGSLVMLGAFGAGLTWASAVIRW